MVALVRFLPFLVVASCLVVVLPLPSASALADPNPASKQWIEGTITLHQPSLTIIDFSGTLVIRKYVIDGTDFRTADDLGAAYQQLLAADAYAKSHGQPATQAPAFVQSLSSNITKAFAHNLQEAFPHATVTAQPAIIATDSLGPASGDPYAPGVTATIAAHVVRPESDLGLKDSVTEEQVKAAFEVGAVVTSTLTFTAQPGENIRYIVVPPESPEGLQFIEASGEGASVTGGNLVMAQDLSKATQARSTQVGFRLAKADAPAFTAQQASLDVSVDLKDLDITFGKAIGGDLGNLIGEVNVVGKLHVIKVPDDVRAQFGDKVQLGFLSSDALRLLKARGLVDDAKIASLQKDLQTQLKQKLEGALGTSVAVDASIDPASLGTDYATPLSGDKPLVIRAHATFTKPLSGGASGGNAGAAIALYKQAQSFDLPRVQGLDTAYTVILPKGLSVTNLDVSGGNSTTGTAPDGRDQFTVTPQGDSAHATVTMAVTPTFVIAKFLPIVLLAILLLVLIIATPIAVVVLRRRRKA